MANLITDDAVIKAYTDRDRLTLRIEGGNTGILIGRKGQTLDAMQFLTDKIINRKSEARVRVRVDIEGYMETRKANSSIWAIRWRKKPKKTGVGPANIKPGLEAAQRTRQEIWVPTLGPFQRDGTNQGIPGNPQGRQLGEGPGLI